MLLHVAKKYYMLCNVVTRGIVLLNFVQQCSMLCCVVSYQELLHVVLHVMQYCYMLPRIITCCAVLCYQDYMLSSVVACYLVIT